MRVLIVDGNNQYVNMFMDRGWTVVTNILDADLVQFTGGADVTPEIYHEKNTHSHNSFNRDLHEAGYFAIAERMGIPMAGICRGGQFLNVMCGGKMIQHVEGHATGKTHQIITDEEKVIQVTSTHHQMMVPEEYGAVLKAWGNIVHKTKDKFNPGFEEYDSEVLYYVDHNCLCFQPHPEFPGYKECQDYYFELLERCLGLKVKQ